jgi:hypothetical protein
MGCIRNGCRPGDVRQETSQLEQQLLTRDRRIADFEQQVETLQGLGPDRVKALFVVDRIELASLTGGADYDDIPGDDGVTVYLRPLDADGHILKAAGEIIIELLDVSVPGQPRPGIRRSARRPAARSWSTPPSTTSSPASA